MLATNIAALVVVRRGGLDPQSLQQIYNSWNFLKLIAVNGFLPITFTLANLHLVGMLSWYLILLSGLTVVLSTATLAALGSFNPESEMYNLATLARSGGPAECGGMRPGVYCYGPRDYLNDQGSGSIENAAYQILGFCLVVLFLLIGSRSGFLPKISRRYGHLLRHPISRPKKSRLWNLLLWGHDRTQFLARRLDAWVSASHRWQLVIWGPRTIISKFKPRYETTLIMLGSMRFASGIEKIDSKTMAKGAVKLAFYATFFAFYIKFFKIILHDLAWFAQSNVYNVNWNFGQVCAITVWALPICEYIHLEVRGMQRAFDHRLMSPFRVTRSSDVETAAETGKVSVPDHDDADLRRCEGSESKQNNAVSE
ncbi:MAG: hypothetical protein LQ350_000327 [Teloschistes chrysophthalmus]|nr:MAG: hypothetical protein LQ350_000327 [Niorma chrysophthalma]